MSYKPYIGFHKDSWTEDPSKATISDNKYSGKLPDDRVFNRNKGKLFYSISDARLAPWSQLSTHQSL